MEYDPSQKHDSREFLFDFVNIWMPQLRDHVAISTTQIMMCKDVNCNRYDYLRSEDTILLSLSGAFNTIQEGIDNYFRDTLMDKSVCEKCSRNDSTYMVKNVRKVNPTLFVHNVDAHQLNLEKILVFERKTYYLIAFNIAKGFSEQERHYTAVRKINGEWMEFDDSKVRKYFFENLQHWTTPYILLYVTLDYLPTTNVTASTPIFDSPEFESWIIPNPTVRFKSFICNPTNYKYFKNSNKS